MEHFAKHNNPWGGLYGLFGVAFHARSGGLVMLYHRCLHVLQLCLPAGWDPVSVTRLGFVLGPWGIPGASQNFGFFGFLQNALNRALWSLGTRPWDALEGPEGALVPLGGFPIRPIFPSWELCISDISPVQFTLV